MENRLQHLLLKLASCVLFVASASLAQAQNSKVTTDIESEFLEFGASVGVINIEDFPSEYTTGLNLTFRATEDLFLQVNVMLASDVELSSAEKDQGAFFADEDRDFLHYDMLVGYNIFQGEFFTSNTQANLSTLYMVGGVGETEFGNESNFTYTLGLGYKVAFNRRYIMNIDIREYIYESSLIAEDDATVATHMTVGFSYLF